MPTRITSATSTLTDIILTNNPITISNTAIIAAGLSDHNLTACVRKLNNNKYQPETVTYRDYSNYDVNTINNELLNANWDTVYNSTSPITAWTNMKSILSETLTIVIVMNI